MLDKMAIIKEFKLMLEEVSRGLFNTKNLFKYLKKADLQKVELMIVDSAIKGMPLENLDKTLLLTKESYIKMLQNLTLKFIDMYQTKTKNNNTLVQTI